VDLENKYEWFKELDLGEIQLPVLNLLTKEFTKGFQNTRYTKATLKERLFFS